MNELEIQTTIFGMLTDECMAKTDLFRAFTEMGVKPIQVNKALKALEEKGDITMTKKNDKVIVKIAEGDKNTEEAPVKELKRAPEARERRILFITEEDAEGLDLLNLRTPPVKADLEYPEGITKEMYDEFKAKILEEENKEIIWDLVSNFNGARGTAITMWEPENKRANEDGRVFYRWDEPTTTWPLMEQLCKIIDLYKAQEAQKAEKSEA